MIGFFIGLACGVGVAVVAHVLFQIGEHENISMDDKEQRTFLFVKVLIWYKTVKNAASEGQIHIGIDPEIECIQR